MKEEIKLTNKTCGNWCMLITSHIIVNNLSMTVPYISTQHLIVILRKYSHNKMYTHNLKTNKKAGNNRIESSQREAHTKHVFWSRSHFFPGKSCSAGFCMFYRKILFREKNFHEMKESLIFILCKKNPEKSHGNGNNHT